MNIREVMTERPECCGVNDTANDAVRVMWERDCGAVPVIDSMGRVSGIVTDRDLCMAAYFQGVPLSQIRLADVMTPQPATCTVDLDLASAERLMSERQIRRLPVVDASGALCGIVSLADVAMAVKRNGDASGRSPESSGLFQTVTAVSEPRR
jgi:CBS domain-containing protein